jgi:hypothetical protein
VFLFLIVVTFSEAFLLLLSHFPYAFFRRRIFLFTCGSLRHLVGLLGRGISTAQGPYLHRTTQTHRNTDTHPCTEQDSNQRS